MAKPRWITLLVTFALLLTASSIIGHFATDVACVLLDSGHECTATTIGNGSNSALPIAADLHTGFNLPTNLPALSFVALAFILIPSTLSSLSYSRSPTLPPPKSLS